VNPNLRIFCGDDNSKPAGIFRWKRNEIQDEMGAYDHICGIDKNEVPEFAFVTENGSILKSGWRRVLRILIANRIIRQRDAERVFGANLSGRGKTIVIPTRGPKRTLIDKYVCTPGAM
jgi:hypothetical protein